MKYPDNVAAGIAAAYAAAASGDMIEAAINFRRTCRLMAETCDVAKLKRNIEGAHQRFDTERRSFQRGIAKRNESSTARIVVLADSLGLPAFEDKTPTDPCFDRTYSYVLTTRTGKGGVRPHVTPLCRRYATMADVAAMLAEPTTIEACHDAHVLLHVGLNDTAVRMFIEEERISMSLLPEEIRESVLEFAKKFRRQVILSDTDYTYTPYDLFVKLLDANITAIKSMQAKSVTLATVILPPSRVWPSTPLINWNYGRYNMAIMMAARQHGAMLLDADHLIWEAGNDSALRPDGMHLSLAGCNLFADRYMALINDHGWA